MLARLRTPNLTHFNLLNYIGLGSLSRHALKDTSLKTNDS